MQVIGCVFNDISLLDYTDRYNIVEEDFCNDFHKIVFGSIYKLHELGAKTITIETIVAHFIQQFTHCFFLLDFRIRNF